MRTMKNLLLTILLLVALGSFLAFLPVIMAVGSGLLICIGILVLGVIIYAVLSEDPEIPK